MLFSPISNCMWVCMCVKEICTQHANNIKKAFRMFEQDFLGVFFSNHSCFKQVRPIFHPP